MTLFNIPERILEWLLFGYKDTNCLVDIADDKGATLFVVYNMDVRAETKFLSKKGKNQSGF